MVQQKAVHFIFGDYSTYSTVLNMLPELQWNSLQERRLQACSIKSFIMYSVVEVDFDVHLNPMGTLTRGLQLKFRQLPTRLNSFQHSFLPATIRDWNSFPEDIVSLEQFAVNLNNFYMHAHRFCA